MPGASRDEDDVTGCDSDGLAVHCRVGDSLEDDQDLRVGVAVRFRSLARARVDEDEREAKSPVVTAYEVARDLIAGKVGGAYDLHEDSLQGVSGSTGAPREIDEPDRYAAVVTSIGRRRS
jgi:hypothetical protein